MAYDLAISSVRSCDPLSTRMTSKLSLGKSILFSASRQRPIDPCSLRVGMMTETRMRLGTRAASTSLPCLQETFSTFIALISPPLAALSEELPLRGKVNRAYTPQQYPDRFLRTSAPSLRLRSAA